MGRDAIVAAVKAADLVATLSSAGPFTVLAPTDAAFAKLPAGTVESLVKPENKSKLAAILTYHVVAGNIPESTVATLTEVSTVEGFKITIEVKDGAVIVNGNVKVVIADVHCSNGIIHAIDTVLMPPSKYVLSQPSKNSFASQTSFFVCSFVRVGISELVLRR